MSAMASEITGVAIFCLTVCSGEYQRKHQNSASLGNPQVTGGFPHKEPVTRKIIPFDGFIMWKGACFWIWDVLGHKWVCMRERMSFYVLFITVTQLHERHVVSIRRNSNVCSGYQQRNIKAPHYWTLVWWIHWWPMDSRKKPILRQAVLDHAQLCLVSVDGFV